MNEKYANRRDEIGELPEGPKINDNVKDNWDVKEAERGTGQIGYR